MNQQEKIILKQAIDRWGGPSQADMAIEEMSELIKALLKLRRSTKRVDYDGSEMIERYEHVIEEIVDVQIMIDQLKIIFGGNGLRMKQYRQQKIDRLAKLLDPDVVQKQEP